MRAKEKWIRTLLLRVAPSQSILMPSSRLSSISEGMVKTAVIPVIIVRAVLIQKYAPHVVYSPFNWAKKMKPGDSRQTVSSNES